MNNLFIVYDFAPTEHAKYRAKLDNLRSVVIQHSYGNYEPFGKIANVYFLKTPQTPAELLDLIRPFLKLDEDFFLIGHLPDKPIINVPPKYKDDINSIFED